MKYAKKSWGMALTAAGCLAANLQAQDIFVASASGTIGEYGLDGSPVNASLISGLASPSGIAVSGNDVFVANNNGTIGEYTTSGATVNASLISGLGDPWAVAVSGDDLFVLNAENESIGEYTTSGGTVNAALITGLSDPIGITIVPEPSVLALILSGAAPLWLWRRGKHRLRPQ